MPSLNSQKTYWRCQDELDGTPRYQELLKSEFEGYDPQQMLDAAPGRRSFLKLMGASMALAGVGSLSGCRRWPERQLAPYTHGTEDRIPGQREHFATVFEYGGFARPILAASYDGRPIKIEGNPSHDQSLGACGTFAQASILDLYDLQRSRQVLQQGRNSSWEAAAAALKAAGTNGGDGLAVLAEATSSLTQAALRSRLPRAAWFTWEPLNRDSELAGSQRAFGKPLRAIWDFSQAKVVVCFDSDPLSDHPAAVRHSHDWAAGRRTADQGEISRLYVAEPSFTITGTNADIRLPARRDAIPSLLAALWAALNGAHTPGLSGKAADFIRQAAEDLRQAAGRGLVAVGPAQSAEAHDLAHRINEKLGHHGKTIRFIDESADWLGQTAQIKSLVEALHAGKFRHLLILGGNPVYNAPIDLNFASAMKKAVTFHLSSHVDETSRLADWHLPRSHYLEAWGDARTWDGQISIQQPLIHPLHDSRSAIEVLALVAGDEKPDAYELVRKAFAGGVLPGSRFERAWRQALHDGVVSDSKTATVQAGTIGNPAEIPAADGHELELIFHADRSVYDGRFANNGWLQELPDPISKITWDNCFHISPATARRQDLRLEQGDVIRVTIGNLSATGPVNLHPGQAPGSISVALGYGRTAAGDLGNQVGFDAYAMRVTDRLSRQVGLRIEKTGRRQLLAATQDHHLIDPLGMAEREYRATHALVREATIDQYRADRHFAQAYDRKLLDSHGLINSKNVPLQIFEEPIHFDRPQSPGHDVPHRWAMVIDLNACTGCGACVIACQAENNIPIVGKESVARSREMHWLRIDRYFAGDVEDPRALHQPVTCHQCENAPCEQVCPVAATTHDTEGLNVMIYNRCIGTRYCSNNCPYKVRRFNFFDWHAKPPKGATWTGTHLGIPDTQQNKIDPIRRMQFNPDVTVRMRGVMEKCTFCVQRIKAASIPARNEGRRVADGEITPACAQTCSTQAIVFGDLADPDSRVSRLFKNDRNYEMLKQLNVRARLRYLARITNPGAMGQSASPGSGHSHDHKPAHS